MGVSRLASRSVVKGLLAVLFAAVIAFALVVIVQPMQQAHAANSQTMHRLYNPNSGEHFYTASGVEKDNLVSEGWSYESKGWTAPTKGNPVYRLYNPNLPGEHHYTLSVSERDMLVGAGWRDEGIGWYADPANNVPMYRLYNPNEFANNHHYTASVQERDWLLGLGWKDEGIGWYGVNEGDFFALIDIKDYGTVTVSLNKAAAPKTVANFAALATKGFYDGLDFHRIVDGFMMQGGDPDGDGTGGADETISGEFSKNGFNNPLSHTRGTISMARSSDYNSASSQFFIVHQDSTKSLDGNYAAFGRVMEGMDIVDKICSKKYDFTDASGEIVEKSQRPIINSIRIDAF